MKLWSDDNYDLSAALRYNGLDEKVDAIEAVALELTGEKDGRDWHWIVRLKGGAHAYVSGGCDYTGWDCQSNCDWHDAPDLAAAVELAPLEERALFKEMLAKGETLRPAPGRTW